MASLEKQAQVAVGTLGTDAHNGCTESPALVPDLRKSAESAGGSEKSKADKVAVFFLPQFRAGTANCGLVLGVFGCLGCPQIPR